jgi:hypothetical protein
MARAKPTTAGIREWPIIACAMLTMTPASARQVEGAESPWTHAPVSSAASDAETGT